MLIDSLRRMVLRSLAGLAVAEEKLRTGVAWDPLAREFVRDPHPVFRRLRERDPVHRSRLGGGYVVSRYDDCVAVLRDERFSADQRNSARYPVLRRRLARVGALERLEEPSMLLTDPPSHTRLRTLVNKAFTPRAVRALAPRVEAIVEKLLDEVADARGFDVVRTLATPLPIIVIAEMLGVPAEDRERFKHWSDEAVRSLGVVTLSEVRRSFDASRELFEYFRTVAEERRREPRDDLISALLEAEEQGDRLSTKELFNTCQLLLIAGNETTTNLIGLGVLTLQRHPEQWERLVAEPGIVDTTVEELLRFEPPVPFTVRHALEDVAVGGRLIRKGQSAVTLLAAANRDPARFDDPDRFDPTRPENPHLSFGHGIHFCLGAGLARLEARTAFLALARRFPQLRLEPDRVEWSSNAVLRGLNSLPVAV